MNFKINDIEFQYCRDAYNKAFENERSVEVSLGRYFLDKFGGNVTEIGAVLPYYGNDNHEIIDLTDEHPKSKKIDGLEYDVTNKNILCISTIEHMYRAEYGNGSDYDSIIFLSKILMFAKNYLITWGIGYNKFLDDYVKNHPEIPRLILKRINSKNEWEVDQNFNNFEYLFGHYDGKHFPVAKFNNANAICIVTNLPELLSKEDKFYNHFKNSVNDRDKVFINLLEKFNKKPINILEIGAARSLDSTAKGGDGWSSFFWAEYISTYGGSLTIVDINNDNLNNCKTLLSNYQNSNIKFICGDGLDYIDNTYDIIYLDGSDDPYEMLKQFNKIDRKKTLILCDDFHGKGLVLRNVHKDFESIMVNHIHEMAIYNRIL